MPIKEKAINNNVANLVYENAKDLICDAQILFENQRIARAYALCVLSAEQFTKAVEAKIEEAGFKLEPITGSKHEFRLARFALLMILPYLLGIGAYNMFAQLA